MSENDMDCGPCDARTIRSHMRPRDGTECPYITFPTESGSELCSKCGWVGVGRVTPDRDLLANDTTIDEARLSMVHDLHRAVFGDTWARPESPELIWRWLLSMVEYRFRAPSANPRLFQPSTPENVEEP